MTEIKSRTPINLINKRNKNNSGPRNPYTEVDGSPPTPQPTPGIDNTSFDYAIGAGMSFIAIILVILVVLGIRNKAAQAAVRDARNAQELARSTLDSADFEKLRNSIPTELFKNLNTCRRSPLSSSHELEVELTSCSSPDEIVSHECDCSAEAPVAVSSAFDEDAACDGSISSKKVKESQEEGEEFGDEGMVCAICLEVFVGEDNCKQLQPCYHVFHASCFDTWLERSVLCPLCKRPSVPTEVLPDNNDEPPV